MRQLKFRQRINDHFHYFEFKDGMCSGVQNASLDQYPITQFTGVKSIDGIDIYEGDILQFTNDDNLYEVRFWQSGFVIYSRTKYSFHTSSLDYHHAVARIVSNIYGDTFTKKQ